MRSDQVDFWQPRYVSGETPWDLGGIPVALDRWLQHETRTGRVLIPGCGAGHEVRAFHEAGWDVKAIDYAPAAVERATAQLGDLAGKVSLADFFADDLGRDFDVIYERTFLCSMPRDRWQSYVARTAGLLRQDGRLLGHFFFGENDDPPPYPLTDELQRALFGSTFSKQHDEPAVDSLPMFDGRERWQIWQKNAATR
ncbi:MAG: TPMT family class I SAM-dependent methyltransferase [Verrucomicrobiota bacterium]|nr:TPMT family class I SAM-dependent methyltransferase [Verrucomicrobiota bacterium]